MNTARAVFAAVFTTGETVADTRRIHLRWGESEFGGVCASLVGGDADDGGVCSLMRRTF